MVQHFTWYVSVPHSNGTTLKLVHQCTTVHGTTFELVLGVPPGHGTTFKLVRWCTTRSWYNIQSGTSVYHPVMVQHSNWYVGVPPGHGTTFELVRWCTTRP